MDPLKMYFLLKMGIFYGYVSLPEGNMASILFLDDFAHQSRETLHKLSSNKSLEITQQLTFSGGGYKYQGTTRGLQPIQKETLVFFFRETKEGAVPSMLYFLRLFFNVGWEKKTTTKTKTLNPSFEKSQRTSGTFLGFPHPKKINTLPADSRHFPQRHLQDTSLAQDAFGDLGGGGAAKSCSSKRRRGSSWAAYKGVLGLETRDKGNMESRKSGEENISCMWS